MASCVAREECEVLTMDRDTWKRYIAESNRVASTMRHGIIRAFAEQVNTAGASLVTALAQGDVPRTLRAGARMEHTGADEG
jgi:hypothetical protein